MKKPPKSSSKKRQHGNFVAFERNARLLRDQALLADRRRLAQTELNHYERRQRI